MISLNQMFGDETAAQSFWDSTLERATMTPFYVDDLIGVGKTLRNFGYANEELFTQMSRISDAGAVLGWESSNMETTAQTIGYMAQSGLVDTKRLRSLQMQGINVPRYLGGVDTIEELQR